MASNVLLERIGAGPIISNINLRRKADLDSGIMTPLFLDSAFYSLTLIAILLPIYLLIAKVHCKLIGVILSSLNYLRTSLGSQKQLTSRHFSQPTDFY